MEIRTLKCLHLVVFAMVLHAGSAAAQGPQDLGKTDIEALMGIEVEKVFGASERLQPVTEAPASVTIVTARDIARYGYRTLADILRSVRSFYVSNDRNYSYVGVRGFSRPGDYNTRVLLIVNGHRINDAVYDQTPIGADFGLDVAMIDRVEVIRGPASSLYGTSAFFAVVNVITRSGASLNGVSVDLDAGTLGTSMARLSGGRRFANGVDLALSGTLERSGGDARLYFPAFDAPDSNHGVAENLDDERITAAYARLTFGHFAFTATLGRRLKDVPTASFDTIFNEQAEPERTSDRRITIAGQYDRTFGGTHLVLDAGFNHYDYEGRYPFASENAAFPVSVNRDGALGVRLNTGVRVARQLPRNQTLTIGAELDENVRQNQHSGYEDPLDSLDERHSSRHGGVYVQDEIRIRPWLLVNGGLRYDRYEQFGRATPRGAVIVSPFKSTSVKYLYGEAFRAPNAYEMHYYDTTSRNLRPEFIRTNEVVWEQYTSEWLRTSASAYHYTASQLITFGEVGEVATNSPLSRYGFVNDGVIKAKGLELEAEARTKQGLQLSTSYTLQDAKPAGGTSMITNSPRHMAKARADITIGGRGFASAEWQYIGARSTLAGERVAGSSVVHLTTGWPVTSALMITGSIRNLFDQPYADPGSDEHLPDSIPQTQRAARLGLRWTFGVR